MPHCVAVGCNSHSKTNKGGDLTFHRFPSDKKKRKAWEDACGRTQLPKDPRLCAKHFSPDDFQDFGRRQLMEELMEVRGYRRVLKPNAVPTIFPHKKVKHVKRMSSENRAKKQLRQETLDGLLCQYTSSCTSVEGEPSLTLPNAAEGISKSRSEMSLVVSATDSKSVQFSPIKCDAETQTDSCKANAATQWPQDAHFQVAIEHSYTSMQDLVEDDVSNSQDLFSSEIETTSDLSQPQHSQLDPDYTPSATETSQSTQGSQSSPEETNRVFLVFEEQLKQLLRKCCICGSIVDLDDLKELQNDGSQLTLQLLCTKGCSYRWQSQPQGKCTKGIGNLLLTASVFFSGIHFSKFERFCQNMNLKTISADTYATLRKRCVFPVIEKTWEKEQRAVLSAMKDQQDNVICGDGRCDSPGHSAKFCTYTFMDALTEKVVDFKIISCTQVSSSNTMEIKGFKDSLKAIEDNGVKVSTISTDRHPQIVKEMRTNNPEKHHQFDPWHVAKGLSKKLSKIAKSKECEDLAGWIMSIINHLWWSAQTCDGNADLLREKWISVIHHTSNRHEWPGNRYYHSCAHEPLDEGTQRSKLWLKPGSAAHNSLVKTVTDTRLLKDLDHLTKCIHTTTLEVYHSMYLKYLPKRTYFGYDVMVHASMLAALDHNSNVKREQAVYQDGECMGDPKFKIAWSKVHKSFRAKPVMTDKNYNYMAGMMEDVLSFDEDAKQRMDSSLNQSHIMAPQVRLPRSDIISQSLQFSRFK